MPWVQVLLEHLAAWVRSAQQELLAPLVLEELVAQLVRPVPEALQVR